LLPIALTLEFKDQYPVRAEHLAQSEEVSALGPLDGLLPVNLLNLGALQQRDIRLPGKVHGQHIRRRRERRICRHDGEANTLALGRRAREDQAEAEGEEQGSHGSGRRKPPYFTNFGTTRPAISAAAFCSAVLAAACSAISTATSV